MQLRENPCIYEDGIVRKSLIFTLIKPGFLGQVAFYPRETTPFRRLRRAIGRLGADRPILAGAAYPVGPDCLGAEPFAP